MWLKSRLRKALRSLGFRIFQENQNHIQAQFSSLHRATQMSLMFTYQQMASAHSQNTTIKLPSFEEVKLRCYSQNGEDGILPYIFSLIGTTNKKVVEVCAGNGIECNAANLVIHHGWYGLLIDGDEKLINEAKTFYTTCKDTRGMPPFLKHAWVTKESINQIIAEEYGFQGEIDLFSLDMDGFDSVWLDCFITVYIIKKTSRLHQGQTRKKTHQIQGFHFSGSKWGL